MFRLAITEVEIVRTIARLWLKKFDTISCSVTFLIIVLVSNLKEILILAFILF